MIGRVDDRQNRAPDDRGFDHRARVDSNDCATVIDRVVVVRFLLGIDRHRHLASRPNRDLAVVGEVYAVPLFQTQRMWADQHTDVVQQGVRRPPKGTQPPQHEGNLRRLPRVERATGPKHQRPVALEPGTGEEVLRRRGFPVEPLIEVGRAGDHDALGGNAMNLDGLSQLHVVPHDQPMRSHAQSGTCRQVVPARDATQRGDAEPLGAAHKRFVERGPTPGIGDDEDVGTESFKPVDCARLHGQRAFGRGQSAVEKAQVARATGQGQAKKKTYETRRRASHGVDVVNVPRPISVLRPLEVHIFHSREECVAERSPWVAWILLDRVALEVRTCDHSLQPPSFRVAVIVELE